MGVSVEVIKRVSAGNLKGCFADVTFDSVYPTNGEPMPASKFGLGAIGQIMAAPNGGLFFEYDYVNEKIKAFYPTVNIAPIMFEHGAADIKGSVNTDSPTVDAASLPLNGDIISAFATTATGAWAHGALTQPGIGRNVCVVIKNDSGGALSLYNGVATYTITGKWRGAVQTETITFDGSSAGSIADTKFRYKYGVKPFDTVSDFTCNHVHANGLKIALGIGSKIGLPNNLYTPAEADVVKIYKNATNLVVTDLVDTTYMTVNLGTLADNDDFTIVYKGPGLTTIASASAAATEVPNATNLAAITSRVLVWGYG